MRLQQSQLARSSGYLLSWQFHVCFASITPTHDYLMHPSTVAQQGTSEFLHRARTVDRVPHLLQCSCASKGFMASMERKNNPSNQLFFFFCTYAI